MNPLIAAAFGVAGAIAGFTIHYFIEAKDPQRNRLERILVVAAAAIVPALLYVKYQASVGFAVVYGILSVVLLGTSVFDLRKQVIPHLVTLPGIALGLVVSTWLLPIGFYNSVMGMLLGAGILLFTTIIESLRKKEVGGGDWKLAAAIGSFLGPQRVITAMLVAGILGLIAGALLSRQRGGRGPTPSALGPYISAGAIVAMFWK